MAAAFYPGSRFLVLLCLLLGCTVLPPTRQILGSETSASLCSEDLFPRARKGTLAWEREV